MTIQFCLLVAAGGRERPLAKVVKTALSLFSLFVYVSGHRWPQDGSVCTSQTNKQTNKADVPFILSSDDMMMSHSFKELDLFCFVAQRVNA